MADLYLGLDLGTTSLKAVVMDSEMNIYASEDCPSPMIKRDSEREFDADGFCGNVFHLIRTVLSQCGRDAVHVKAVSAASASGNTLFLDKNNAPLYNAISWTDRRVAGKEDEYLPNFDFGGVYETTGWPYIGMFPLTHIAWIKKERPEIFKNCRMICMSTEYLNFKLCGKWGLDTSSATTFYLQNQLKGEYCKKYLDYFGIDENALPPIYPSKMPLGRVTKESSRLTGLTAGTKIITGSFDHPACARGMGALNEGDLLLSCGTSWVGLFVSKDRKQAIKAGLLIDPYLSDEGLWACIFAMTQFGEFINERINQFIDRSDNRFMIFNDLAVKGKNTGKEVVYDLSDSTACKKIWDSFSGEEIAYSIMKSSCSQVKSGIERLAEYGFVPKKIYMAGGPAASEIWPQIMADTIEKDICCLHKQFGGAAGAAVMAAIGDGKFKDERDFFKNKTNKYSIYSPAQRG